MTDTSSVPKPGPRPKTKLANPPEKSDPEGYVKIAKQAVLGNYNSIRDETKARALIPDDLYIIIYSRVLQNWAVLITSPVVRGMIWEVTFNNYRNEVYVNVYQKINSLKISLGEKANS